MDSNTTLDEEELQLLYTWVDDIPLTRPKKNIARDFSDGVLMAEIVKHFFPKHVQLHNYSSACSNRQKLYNWNTLTQKVFKKIGFQVEKQHIDDVVNCVPGAIEKLLKSFQVKVTQIQQRKIQRGNSSHSNNSDYAHEDISPRRYEEDDEEEQESPPPAISRTKASKPTSQQANKVVHEARSTGNQSFEEILQEKDAKIAELTETVTLLESKVSKLNLLIRLKDSKIHALTQKLKDSEH